MKKFIAVAAAVLAVIAAVLSACSALREGEVENPGLEVHFIDVGQADCALVLCDGAAMLIDGGNVGDSSLVYSYLRDRKIDFLDVVVATHPHEDHVGGLSGALSYASAGICYSSVESSDNGAFVKFKRNLDKKGTPVSVPKAGDSFELGGARVTFIGPVEITGDENEDSLVCRLEYGDVSFLFTADAGEKAEKLMLDSGAELKSTVLKVGHHGSAGSTGYAFLRAVDPTYAVISTENNSRYGHPHEATLSRLMDSGAKLYRTDKNGTVVFRTDGSVMSVNAEKGTASAASEPDAEAAPQEEARFIGNISSQVYHRPDCRSLPAEHNRIYFYTLEEAIGSGFRPCGSCKPDAVT